MHGEGLPNWGRGSKGSCDLVVREGILEEGGIFPEACPGTPAVLCMAVRGRGAWGGLPGRPVLLGAYPLTSLWPGTRVLFCTLKGCRGRWLYCSWLPVPPRRGPPLDGVQGPRGASAGRQAWHPVPVCSRKGAPGPATC